MWKAEKRSWSGGPDLNRQPFPWQGNILPLNYHRYNFEAKLTASMYPEGNTLPLYGHPNCSRELYQ